MSIDAIYQEIAALKEGERKELFEKLKNLMPSSSLTQDEAQRIFDKFDLNPRVYTWEDIEAAR